MSLVYVDIHEMEEKFRSYNLSYDNILDFMASDHSDDKYKRMLKLYLCSLLEGYKHIDYLRLLFCLVYKENQKENSMDGAEFVDIISSNSDYSFWKLVLEDRSNLDTSSLLLWMSLYFDDYCKYLFVNDDMDLEKNGVVSADKKSVGEVEERDYLIAKFQQCMGSNISIDTFNIFVRAVSYHIKQNFDNITGEDLVDETKYFCEDVLGGDYVSVLKCDLVFNYNMILDMFSSSLVESGELADILSTIRNLFHRNAKKFLDCTRTELINLGDDYRDFQCVGTGTFWDSTPDWDEIHMRMDDLFKKYKILCADKDDSSYVLKSFELSQELLQIHPYRNGNGRTSKYLLFLLSIKRNILPITVTDGHYLPKCYYRMQSSGDDMEARASYCRYRQEVTKRRFK